MTLCDRARQLLLEQQSEWELLRDNYHGLKQARIRSFAFEGFEVRVQFNPGRITSSSAPVDERSIRARPCFLCRQNRPPQQRELPVGDDLVLLCNPFPIFPEHFTIATLSHTPQQIAANFALLLDLARDLHPHYTVFYNGPKCGASAPDHLHVQAGTRGFMPIDSEYASLSKRVLLDQSELRVFSVDSCLRHFIALEGADRASLVKAFDHVYKCLQQIVICTDEPMINVIVSHQSGLWRTIIFPRARHRPSFYLAEGEGRILLSPAAVDLGGVCITPLQRDFERLTSDMIIRMFEEVCLAKTTFRAVADCVATSLVS